MTNPTAPTITTAREGDRTIVSVDGQRRGYVKRSDRGGWFYAATAHGIYGSGNAKTKTAAVQTVAAMQPNRP